MRKILLIIFVAAFAASVPLSAQAVETSVHGLFWNTFNTSKHVGHYSGSIADDFSDEGMPNTRSFSYTRTIPTITLKISDDLKWVFRFDTSITLWGGEVGYYSIADTTGTTRSVPVPAVATTGAPGYGYGAHQWPGGVNMHTRRNYLDFRIPTTAARLRMGVQFFGDASNLTVIFCECAGIQLSSPLGKGKFLGYWAKLGEGGGWITQGRAQDDADMYGFRVAYPVTENLTLTPQWFYVHGDGAHYGPSAGTNPGFQGKNIHWLGANLKGKFKTGAGALSLNANVWGVTGDYDETDSGGIKGDYKASLFEARATLDMGAIKPGMILLYASGDPNLSDNDRELYPDINAHYGATNLFFVGWLEYWTSVTHSPGGQRPFTTPGIPYTANGITMFQLNAEMKPLKKLTIKPALSFFRASENWDPTSTASPIYTASAGGTLPGATSKDMGVEYGATVTYQIYKNLRWFTYLGGFAPGDFYRYTDGNANAPASAWMLRSHLAMIF